MQTTETLTATDRLEIHELYARYAWALGMGDVDAFVACFAADAVLSDDVFEEVDTWVGHQEIRKMIELFRSGPNFAGRQHHVSHILIEGNGSHANAKSFCFVTHCIGEPPFAIKMVGYYVDVVVKSSGKWLFQERVIRDWSGPILKGIPGQSGIKRPRKRPPDLALK